MIGWAASDPTRLDPVRVLLTVAPHYEANCHWHLFSAECVWGG